MGTPKIHTSNYLRIHICDRQNNASTQNMYTLIPRTCEHITLLHSKRDFIGVTKVMDPKIGGSHNPGLSSVPSLIT